MAAGKKRKAHSLKELNENAHPRLRSLLGAMFFPSNPDLSQKPPVIPARPPRSQKEATMAVEPSQENIDNVTAFCGMDRATAVRYLKVSGWIGWDCEECGRCADRVFE